MGNYLIDNYINAADDFLDSLGDYVDGLVSHAKVANNYRKSSSAGYINANLLRNLNGGAEGRYGYGAAGADEKLSTKGISSIKIGEAYSTNGFSVTNAYSYGNSANARNVNVNGADEEGQYLYNYISPWEDAHLRDKYSTSKLIKYVELEKFKGYSEKSNDTSYGAIDTIEWGGDIASFLRGEIDEIRRPLEDGILEMTSAATAQKKYYDFGDKKASGITAYNVGDKYSVNYDKAIGSGLTWESKIKIISSNTYPHQFINPEKGLSKAYKNDNAIERLSGYTVSGAKGYTAKTIDSFSDLTSNAVGYLKYTDGNSIYTTWSGGSKSAYALGESGYTVEDAPKRTESTKEWDAKRGSDENATATTFNEFSYEGPYIGPSAQTYTKIGFREKSGNTWGIDTEFSETVIDKTGFGDTEINNGSYGLYNERENKTNPLKNDANVSYADGDVYFEITNKENPKSLICKTSELFRNGKIESMISRFTSDNSDKYSRGRNLKRGGDAETNGGYNNPYCRTWTANYQYSKVGDLMRSQFDHDTFKTEMAKTRLRRPSGKGEDLLQNHSVLGKNGFVKIAPSNSGLNNPKEDIKRCMFSIENLAWKDISTVEYVLDDDLSHRKLALSPEQQGDHGGRIMWFPPYNIKFSEQVSVDWNENRFIGRGESLYTYTNTKRTGTLDFTLLIDHPSVINAWAADKSEIKDDDEKDLLRFFAGCGSLKLDESVVGSTPAEYGEEVLQGYEKKTETYEESVVDTEAMEARERAKAAAAAEAASTATDRSSTAEGEYVEVSKKIAFVMFFPNNYTSKKTTKKGDWKLNTAVWNDLKNYENGAEGTIINYVDPMYSGQTSSGYSLNINSKFKLNNFTAEDVDIKEEIKRRFPELSDMPIENIYSFYDLYKLAKEDDYNFLFGENFEFSKRNGKIATYSHASTAGALSANTTIMSCRAHCIQQLCYGIKGVTWENDIEKSTKTIVAVNGGGINNIDSKYARSSVAVFDITLKEYVKPSTDTVIDDGGQEVAEVVSEEVIMKTVTKTRLVDDTSRPIYTRTIISNGEEKYTNDDEYRYFKELDKESPLVFKNIVDKIQYFDPAFHSITPEGFNERLTFLHQCTRQGGTKAVSETHGSDASNGSEAVSHAANLAFGRAPFCVLRIGDFFNTKICIDSMSINYDNNGVQWDLNPEGAGVQPMFANVSLTFTFLGGQDITGPVEELQNAISSRYYANASIYDSRVNMK